MDTTQQRKRIPRTFVFDKNISQNDYNRYISMDDLLNESFEQMRDEFENYRKITNKKKPDTQQLKTEDQALQKFKSNDDINKIQKTETTALPQQFNTQYEPEFGSTQNTLTSNIQYTEQKKKQKILYEENSIKGVIQKSKMKINEMTAYANQLKKNVMKPNFGFDHKSRSQQTIRKTQLQKEYVFSEQDFEKMIKEDEVLKNKNNTNHKFSNTKFGFVERIKKIGDSKKINKNHKNYSTYLIHHDFQKPIIQKDEANQNLPPRTRTQGIDVQKIKNQTDKELGEIDKQIQNLEKTWSNFGVFKKNVNNLRANILEYSRYMKINQQLQLKYKDGLQKALDGNQKTLDQQKKDQNLLLYIKNIISKPEARSDFKATEVLKFHQQRLNNMHVESVQPINLSYKFDFDQ